MSVLSILNSFKKCDAKVLIPLVFVVGFFLKTVHSISPAASDRKINDGNVETLPFCDEQLINDRGNAKR